ncbi:phenylacetate--CoA ligase family protein [Desulfopila sp. IMCC35006]|uniref:phenylacetate--CoA ligase family protein n=1 Tax=Desulfopila sp. IMCC35006 TaxID=2569542 RepID=UPI0010AB743F|nr:phenylacetate--CoA ligase family protein [Desulfopila sp. IMCC35006]TKB23957.1 phenylacetate--CoA ligase family protein [Desulfopila sp. IMCC35006]
MIRRNIFEPIHCLIGKSPKLRHWKALEISQYLSETTLREIQWQRLGEIVRFSFEQNDFYRKRFRQAGLTPEDIRSPSDLRRLPVLTKSELRNNMSELISRGYHLEKLQQSKTGGSTGKSLELYFTEECSELRNACSRRHDRWTGWEPGEPVAAIWGNPHYPATVKEKLKQWMLSPVIYLDTMSVNEKAVLSFIEEWHKVRPTLIMGHAHSIFLLSQYLRDMSIKDLRPKGILSTSMMLIPSERRTIEEVFGLKVTDRYGCEEVSLIACECEKHEGMHLNIEHLFIEFIKDDGMPAASGEPGILVVTDLMNRAMPLIRYQVEDVGIPTDRKCSCGRGLPLMESITGRVADFLLKKDGTRVAGVSLIENTLTKLPGIVQMQIIQDSLELVTLNLVVDTHFNTLYEDKLVNYFEALFEHYAHIQINYVDAFNCEDNGKFRFSICKIKQ